ncbi:L-glutamate gamma-semialdehyde dehydrogenase [Paenibacillus sp. BIHB 4019]|uniref:L-glutamate gamma-semialdehyde dehydrogenase n=1 Tax=Paenibacillus sp. BIHB 4019 TaxID=1870819 RepID=A0A1B2DK38_9BACL|nr:L-glutamate gamma-semialdehyde dehydrogenase [Paenibacillus sp. BIHB 4019]ANY68045.1 L-glutamate gamma-semialdehyde dehydrogenase [Paenibacillus sp. BIHB 4019]
MITYVPEPFTDFTIEANSEALAAAISQVQQQLGQVYPLIIGGSRVMTEETQSSINPSSTSEVVGRVSKANAEQADQAIASASETFKSWSKVPVAHRARLLFKAAAILRRRKHEFNAWLMIEAGKTRGEADADTAEAIDFLEYYARQMLEMSETAAKKLIVRRGEDNDLQYIPLGVGVVIPPWNFPLAIMAGMTTAAVVAGNTVVLKPASTTPVIAYKFVEVLEQAGMPAGVVQFLPGSGAEIGDLLVTHPLTRFISFTGSREVGLRIFELSAKTSPGQIWLKRFVGELGGKDAIVVDSEADLEAAAQAIVASAFSFSGQKCSACSRAIVHEAVYDAVLKRCTELTEALTVGNTVDFNNYTGPVIDSNAYRKIFEYIETGSKEGRLVTGGEKAEGDGYYIQPTIIADLKPDAVLMQEEVFGPVLGFCKASSYEEALEIANNTEYGLTGAVFSTNRVKLELAREQFHVGNLYFNRKCTGAIVGVHPFGGFNMSGTDSKAGGPDYLLQFTQLKLISEQL